VNRRRFVLVLTLIAAAGFIGRAVYILAVTREKAPAYDELYYRTQATTLADGNGFELPFEFGFGYLGEGEHPPLTGILLSPAAALTDSNDVAMRFTVALAGIGAIVLIGLIAREIAGESAGLVAAGVAAVYPNLWVTDGLLLPETFAVAATAAAVFCAYRLMREPTWTWAAGLGAACALAMLTRSELLLLVPLLALPAVLTNSRTNVAHRFQLVGVTVLAVAVLVAPWQIYLMTRFAKPGFLSYGDAGALAGANCSLTYSGPRIGSWEGLCKTSGKVTRQTDVVERSADPSVEADKRRQEARRYMREHFKQLPLVLSARVARVWSAYRPFQMAKTAEAEGRPRWISLVGWGTYWVLAGFAVVGAVMLRRRKVPLIPLLAPVVIVTIVAALFYGIVRFRAPAEVSIVVLAAVALDALLAKRVSMA
jgi:4-amino-4-deoxy-L-arabinose transferase-like glycosyltransferase